MLPRYTFFYIKMGFGLIVVLGMGYFALVALNPKARQWATQGGADGSGGPTPFNALNQILAIPVRAIGKTKGVIADNEKKGRESKPLTDIFSKATAEPGKPAAGVDKEADDQSVSRERLLALTEKNTAAAMDESAKPVALKSVPLAPPPPPGPAEMKLGGGITITNCPAPYTIRASAPFMYWVAGLSVSGVSNSTPPRFLMNNKLVRQSEEVNKTLGVTFDHLDAAAKLIYFRDKSGAMVSRSY